MVRFERDGRVGRLILETLPTQGHTNFAGTLRESIRRAAESDIRVLVVTADDGIFTVNADPSEVLGGDGSGFRAFVADANASFRMLDGLRVPTVASVRHSAVGGGFELALACDFLIAAEAAVLYCGDEIKVGMVPVAGGVQRLAERVGRARATRLVMMAERVTGTEALKLGIATHVAPANQLEQTTAELAQALAAGPTLAYVATRGLLKAWSAGGVSGADTAMPDLTAGLYDSEDARKGQEAMSHIEPGSERPILTFSGK
jgi:enoyl-CoA hydratase/carnithine racemase